MLATVRALWCALKQVGEQDPASLHGCISTDVAGAGEYREILFQAILLTAVKQHADAARMRPACKGNIGCLPVMAASSTGVAWTSRATAACLKPSPSWKQGCSRSALARLSCGINRTGVNSLSKLCSAKPALQVTARTETQL